MPDPFRTLDDPEPEPRPAANPEVVLPVWPPAGGVPVRARLYVWGGLVISSHRPMPGAFRRFWYWALLGWTWEEVV